MNNEQEPAKIPFNVDFLDRVTDGGLRPGQSMLYGAPAGSGRTLLALQTAVQAARAGQYVNFFPIDQDFQGHTEMVLNAVLTGSSIKDWLPYGEVCSKLHLGPLEEGPDMSPYVAPDILARLAEQKDVCNRIMIRHFVTPVTKAETLFAKVDAPFMHEHGGDSLLVVDGLNQLHFNLQLVTKNEREARECYNVELHVFRQKLHQCRMRALCVEQTRSCCGCINSACFELGPFELLVNDFALLAKSKGTNHDLLVRNIKNVEGHCAPDFMLHVDAVHCKVSAL